MRLRNIPGADEAVASSTFCIQNPEQYYGKWSSYFQNTHPLHIEIGMGKGQFITQMAILHPEINYIGIEMYTSVLLRAIQKLSNIPDPPPNLCFICMNAEKITEIFSMDEVSRIYLNFSDPWPKDRHAKRRLTSKAFLDRYKTILTDSGTIEFKTDNKTLFDYSMHEIPAAGWQLSAFTNDLHHDINMNHNNVMTEYEEKFSSIGNPIYKLIAVVPLKNS